MSTRVRRHLQKFIVADRPIDPVLLTAQGYRVFFKIHVKVASDDKTDEWQRDSGIAGLITHSRADANFYSFQCNFISPERELRIYGHRLQDCDYPPSARNKLVVKMVAQVTIFK